MRDAERRRRFVRWFGSHLGNDRAKLMQRTGLTKGRVTQLLDPEQPFGERAAGKLALKLRLPDDYFEREEAPEGATPPTQPPPSSPREVSDDDLALLQDIKTAMRVPSLAQQLRGILLDVQGIRNVAGNLQEAGKVHAGGQQLDERQSTDQGQMDAGGLNTLRNLSAPKWIPTTTTDEQAPPKAGKK